MEYVDENGKVRRKERTNEREMRERTNEKDEREKVETMAHS